MSARRKARPKRQTSTSPVRGRRGKVTDCPSGKRTWRSRAKVERWIRLTLGERRRDPNAPHNLWAYECRQCGKWHTSSSEPRRPT